MIKAPVMESRQQKLEKAEPSLFRRQRRTSYLLAPKLKFEWLALWLGFVLHFIAVFTVSKRQKHQLEIPNVQSQAFEMPNA
jgi:hypothetical protein